MVGSKLERYPLFGPFLLKEKEPSLCRDIHRLQSREPRHHWRMRNCARWQALYRFSHSRYMAWRGAAATAQNVHLPLLSPLPHQRCGLFGHFVILTKLIGKTRIGVNHDQRVGEMAKRLHMRTKLLSPEGANKPHGDARRRAHGEPQRLDHKTERR